MSKYAVFSGPYFPVFGLNTNSVFSPNAGKYGPEKTPYLDTFHAVMGTKCGSTYANIFMGIFEENYIYHLIKEKCKLYLRHIDDIFLVWTGTLDELN